MDRTDALIVRKVLEALAGRGGSGEWRVEGGETRGSEFLRLPPRPGLRQQAQVAQAAARPAGGASESMTLQEVMALVVAGCRGDRVRGQRAWELATQVMQDRQQPAAVQALGVAFQRLLAGVRERDEVLAGLPAEIADVVDAVLAQV